MEKYSILTTVITIKIKTKSNFKNIKSMKKLFILTAIAILAVSCEKPILAENEQVPETPTVTTDDNNLLPPSKDTKKFTFTLKGDFSNEWKPITRGYLQADGRDMTDVWVLDYLDGELVQQMHQTDNTAEDFGKPVMNLKLGSHHVYFIASRGTTPTLNTETKVISWERPSDTFFRDYEVSVVATSNGNRSVDMTRIATKLKLYVTDAIPDEAVSINITPTKWYYGWNYVTGAPVMQKDNQKFTLELPASVKGKENYFSASMLGLSTADAWNTNIYFSLNKSDETVIGEATITDASFKANRETGYEGPLCGTSGEMALVLNDTWDEPFHGTW